MTTYTTIPDADISPDKPIKSSTAFALRDNVLAIAEGDATAPSINPAALFIGGKGGDGAWTDATNFTAPGFYEFSSMLRTSPMNLPDCSIIRIAGNAQISTTLTVGRYPHTKTLSSSIYSNDYDAQKKRYQLTFGAVFGEERVSEGTGIRMPGASIGSANSSNVKSIGIGSLYNTWNGLRPLIGGGAPLDAGPYDVYGGGGSIILIIEGNLLMTGGTITTKPPTVLNTYGAGGGSIIVVCLGSITNGTFISSGGDGSLSLAGGGGGLVQLIATQYIGTQTGNVAAGSGGTSDAGLYQKLTFTRDQIRTMLQRY